MYHHSSNPRPILKSNAQSYCHASRQRPLVHFPPSPALTRTATTFSASTYDRSPIVVTNNDCALPERGCPGRTYVLGDGERCQASRWMAAVAHNGVHRHPSALKASFAAEQQQQQYHDLPFLEDDVHSSPSEADEPPEEINPILDTRTRIAYPNHSPWVSDYFQSPPRAPLETSSSYTLGSPSSPTASTSPHSIYAVGQGERAKKKRIAPSISPRSRSCLDRIAAAASMDSADDCLGGF